MNRLLFLNLPKLPEEIEQEIVRISDNIPPDESGRKWIEEFHDNEIQAVSHVYGRANNILGQELQDTIQQIYGKFFDDKLFAIVGKLDNTQGYRYAVSPPHCDRARYVAVNYIIKSGGDHVLTCLYNERRSNDDLTAAENIKYNQLTLNCKVCLPEREWHSYNVQYAHSVENIENTRILFSLFPVSNPDFETFQKKYKDLIKCEY